MGKIIIEYSGDKEELVESLDRVLYNHVICCMNTEYRGIPSLTDVSDTMVIRELLDSLKEAQEDKP